MAYLDWTWSDSLVEDLETCGLRVSRFQLIIETLEVGSLINSLEEAQHSEFAKGKRQQDKVSSKADACPPCATVLEALDGALEARSKGEVKRLLTHSFWKTNPGVLQLEEAQGR